MTRSASSFRPQYLLIVSALWLACADDGLYAGNTPGSAGGAGGSGGGGAGGGGGGPHPPPPL
jgi:hypothetical protein